LGAVSPNSRDKLDASGRDDETLRVRERRSSRHYVNWNLHSNHDMTADSVLDVGAFLTAGNCSDAPTSVVSAWP
jgi:hypothetical protein